MNSQHTADGAGKAVSADDAIEGLEDPQEAPWDYPIDTLLVRNENRTVHGIMRRIKSGFFVMNPEFQRDFIWSEEKQSRLIESVLMRIPLPVFYLAEDAQGRLVIVDGLQRLSTFQRFCDNALRLKLPGKAELHGKRFGELPAKLQNRIEDCNLTLYILDQNIPERARLDMFERVNSGQPLTRQQMRNCIYMGPATAFLKEEAGTDSFKQATGEGFRPGAMRDREFVNRFCAFQLLGWAEYKGSMDEFLATVLKNMNGMTSTALEDLSKTFRNGLDNNFNVFGKHAFRKHEKNQPKRTMLNASLWDVMSTGLSRYSADTVTARTPSLQDAFYRLLENEAFSKTITISTGNVKDVQARFAMAGDMFKDVFGC